jgi:phage gp36-like protein
MWRELTEDDVLGVLSAPEVNAYKIAAAGVGQDVLSDILTSVVNHCRGYIADNPANRLAEGVTLPERTHRPALHIVRFDLLTRLNLNVSDDRRSANREAIRFFERVAEGKVQIEQPTGATDDSGPVQTITVISTHERQATRENLSGL